MRGKTSLTIFTISFVMLFLEIFLIRWIATEIRIFAYISNCVLLACFLGIGTGCLLAKKEPNILITFGLLTIISLCTSSTAFKEITYQLSGFSDSVIWYESLLGENILAVANGVLLTLALFAMILVTFIPLGQVLGRLFDASENIILAYSVNIVASLLGIWTFSLFSFFHTPPWVWFMFALTILFFFVPRKKTQRWCAIAASVLILLVTGVFDIYSATVWSPYQKLTVKENKYLDITNGYVLNVNNIGYMSLLDLSDDFIRQYPSLYDSETKQFNQYELPYRFSSRRENVLIVGAGAGNDVAGALRSGARNIDAVEIDAGIYRLGVLLHPEQPYAQHNVNVIIDDARAFFKKATKQYDVISFGLLDAHTLSSRYNNTRLDHYVYTLQSFQEAKKLLTKDGVLSVLFMARREWIGARIYGLLQDTFGEVPYVFRVKSYQNSFGWGGHMFITSNNITKLKETVAADSSLSHFIQQSSISFDAPHKPTTDDWPYLYIQNARIPTMYVCIIACILLLLISAAGALRRASGSAINYHFFFLGAAFLLLEFQNVSKSALLFGSTWIVNAYIISSILFLILAANIVVYYGKIKSRMPSYLLLCISLVFVYILPLEAFNHLSGWIKPIVAALTLNVPVFFAAVIFIVSFKHAPVKDTAFGSNLMGAAVGGLLESVSFITGIKALLVLVFFLYLCSALAVKKQSAVP